MAANKPTRTRVQPAQKASKPAATKTATKAQQQAAKAAKAPAEQRAAAKRQKMLDDQFQRGKMVAEMQAARAAGFAAGSR
jgi:hypothetical protein